MLWFIVPAHGRVDLARACFRQLRRTCDDLARLGVRASAVVIACDDNLETARELGFATVERDNHFLGRRFNDGFEAAAGEGVEYVVPVGSDDWVDAAWVAGYLPDVGEVRCSRLMSTVSEDGRCLATLSIDYRGGHGIRVIPTGLLEPRRYRPADEFRRSAIDTSILQRLSHAHLTYYDTDAYAVVDWKSPAEQLHSFASLERHALGPCGDPWSELAGRFPPVALDEMAAVYAKGLEVAA